MRSLRVARTSPHAAARLQALWTLEALDKLDDPLIAEALNDESPGVRENALSMAERRLRRNPELAADRSRRWSEDPSPTVRYQLAFTLGEVRRAGAIRGLEHRSSARTGKIRTSARPS